MLTPEALRNPSRKSGFDCVNMHPDERRRKRYRGQRTNPDGVGMVAVGPWRLTGAEAAADYAAYANGNPATPAKPALKSAGHPRAAKRELTPERQVALDILRDSRAKNTDPGTVYLAIEDGDWARGKIGWTGKEPPEARLGDYQAGNPRRLEMVGKIAGTKDDETALHQKYIHLNELGEWFRLIAQVLSEFNLQEETKL